MATLTSAPTTPNVGTIPGLNGLANGLLGTYGLPVYGLLHPDLEGADLIAAYAADVASLPAEFRVPTPVPAGYPANLSAADMDNILMSWLSIVMQAVVAQGAGGGALVSPVGTTALFDVDTTAEAHAEVPYLGKLQVVDTVASIAIEDGPLVETLPYGLLPLQVFPRYTHNYRDDADELVNDGDSIVIWCRPAGPAGAWRGQLTTSRVVARGDEGAGPTFFDRWVVLDGSSGSGVGTGVGTLTVNVRTAALR